MVRLMFSKSQNAIVNTVLLLAFASLALGILTLPSAFGLLMLLLSYLFFAFLITSVLTSIFVNKTSLLRKKRVSTMDAFFLNVIVLASVFIGLVILSSVFAGLIGVSLTLPSLTP